MKNKLYFRVYEKIGSIIYGKSISNVFLKWLVKFSMRIYKFVSGLVLRRKMKKRANGKYDPKYIKIRKFKNIHNGKRCFIICTGPSLKVEDVNRLKGECTFSMNSIIKMFEKTNWRPTYYAISDALVYNLFRENEDFKRIRGKFISSDISKVIEVSDEDVVFPEEGYSYFKHGHAVNFSDDMYSCVYAGGTITYGIMQIAVYMGFKEIYLLGCDHNFDGKNNHFAEYGNAASDHTNFDTSPTTESYKVAKKYADEHGIKIYNATRGGKLEVFERVDFDSLFGDTGKDGKEDN